MAEKKSLRDKLFNALTRYRRIHPWVAEDAIAAILPVVRQEIRREVRKATKGQPNAKD